MYVAYVCIDSVVLKCIPSAGHEFLRRGDGENMVLITIEAVPAGSEPSAAGGMRISTGERRGLALQPLRRSEHHPYI